MIFGNEVSFTGIILSLVFGIVVNTIAMWLVASYLLSIPGIKFKACFKAVILLILMTAVMLLSTLVFRYIPFFGFWAWLLATFFVLKATVEGSLDVPSGGGTILLLYICVQAMIFYFMNQLFSAGAGGSLG